MKLRKFLLAGCALMLIRFDAQSTSQSPVDVGSEKQLFIDDLFIASSDGIRLVVNQPLKSGERNVVPDQPWEEVRVGYPNTVMEDQGRYRMWYDAAFKRRPTDALPDRITCYAESDDGVRWRKPVIGTHEFRGSRENNIALATTPGTVFVDPKAPSAERYKFMGRNRAAILQSPAAGAGLWIFGSPDGLRFAPLFGGAATDIRSDTHEVAFWDPTLNKYVAYIKYIGRGTEPDGKVRVRPPAPTGALGNRKVWRMETDDLRRWPEPQLVLAMDAGDRRDSDFYNSAALRYPYAARAYLLFPSAYYHYVAPGSHPNDGPLDIQLAVSRDGIRFTRPDRHPFVRQGLEGSFDSRAMYMGVGMIRRGDELWMYYVGFAHTHGDVQAKKTKHGVISRLVLRLDGFVSADADYRGGEITTPLLRFDGKHLEINLDASAGGAAQVEILDPAGAVVPGFSLDDADPLEGNSVRRVVSWKGRRDVSMLAGKPVRLRWKMRDCKLFAFQFVK